jgi:Uma2 family endonuclease
MITHTEPMTVERFEQLVATGRWEKSRERVELIRGELRVMSPAGPAHADILSYLVEWSVPWVKKYGYSMRSEQCVKFADQESVPEPDLVWVKRGRYSKAHPTSNDVVLAIEVSYSSLGEDRSEMYELYAEGGVPEYWIANCIENVVEVHRQPRDGAYHDCFVVKSGGKISPLVAPEAILDVADLFAEQDEIS